MQLLVSAGADRTQAHQAVTAMEPVYSARHLRPGQELAVAFADLGNDAPGPLLFISFRPNRERDIEISRSTGEEDFFAESIDRPVARQLAYAEGTRSEEHTSELQSLMRISYAVFCLKTKNKMN